MSVLGADRHRVISSFVKGAHLIVQGCQRHKSPALSMKVGLTEISLPSFVREISPGSIGQPAMGFGGILLILSQL